MSAWECRKCTAAYAPGAPACPQCGTNDPVKEAEQLEKEREQMPKITVHGGPSNADAEDPQTGDSGEVETDGAETEQTEQTAESTATPDTKPKLAARAGRKTTSE